jgi:ribosomal protein S18 acetylase RimI-like enzyme
VTLEIIEDYYDAVPRFGARAEDFGPLTLFVREGDGWPFYARPVRTGTTGVTADHVEKVRQRQRELNIPEAFEWVDDLTPSLRAAVEATGLAVHEHPLMVLDPAAFTVPEQSSPPARVLGPDDPALTSAVAVGHLAFADGGTKIGEAGLEQLAVAVADRAGDGSAERMAERIRTGRTVMAAAITDDDIALCSGAHQPVGATTEIVGVGTLPAARRQGLALAVTGALVADALAQRVTTVFLSAGDEDVARIYGRLGFRRIGTALIAEA